MSMLSNLQRQCPNNLLNLQLIEVYISIWQHHIQITKPQKKTTNGLNLYHLFRLKAKKDANEWF
jgi:hypothetical protein